MHTSFIYRDRAVGRAFWLAILLLAGAAAAYHAGEANQPLPAVLAWGSDEDPDAGGESA